MQAIKRMRLERLGNVVVSSVASQHKAGSPLLSMCLQVYFRYSGCLPESEYMKRWFEQVIQMLKCYCGGPCSSRYHRPTLLSCQKWRLNMLLEKKNKKQQINKTHIISAKAFSYRYACFFFTQLFSHIMTPYPLWFHFSPDHEICMYRLTS